jgi:hypothetical protein
MATFRSPIRISRAGLLASAVIGAAALPFLPLTAGAKAMRESVLTRETCSLPSERASAAGGDTVKSANASTLPADVLINLHFRESRIGATRIAACAAPNPGALPAREDQVR